MRLCCSGLDPTSFQMLDDEEEALAAAEMEAQVASEEAARAERRAEGKLEGALADRVARLQRRAKKAAERVASLKLVVEGPPAVEVRFRSPPCIFDERAGIL